MSSELNRYKRISFVVHVHLCDPQWVRHSGLGGTSRVSPSTLVSPFRYRSLFFPCQHTSAYISIRLLRGDPCLNYRTQTRRTRSSGGSREFLHPTSCCGPPPLTRCGCSTQTKRSMRMTSSPPATSEWSASGPGTGPSVPSTKIGRLFPRRELHENPYDEAQTITEIEDEEKWDRISHPSKVST